MNTNIIIIANINAVVEKLEGKINIKVIKTGSQSSFRDHKTIGSSLVLINTLLQNKQYQPKQMAEMIPTNGI
jgi:hypothetical protein